MQSLQGKCGQKYHKCEVALQSITLSIQSRWEKWHNNVLHSQSTNNAPIDMENLGKGLHNQEILDGLVFQI